VIAQTQDSLSQLRLLTTGAGEPKRSDQKTISITRGHSGFPDGKRVLFFRE